MTNQEKYKEIFKEILEIDESRLTDSLGLDSVPQWDSMGHVRLISALESNFGIVFSLEDIKAFKTMKSGKAILARHGIVL